jgi:HK97 family phage portal protein
MSWLRRLGAATRRFIRNMTSAELLKEIRRGQQTDGGEWITPERALAHAAAFASVRVLGETMGTAPCLVYERRGNGRARATEHWAYQLLHDRPNEWQTPFEFKEMLTAHAVQSGAGYALKTVVRGEVRELLPIAPHLVELKQDAITKRVWFEISMPDGTRLPVPRERMFYLPFMTLDGLRGISLVSYQRETLGIGLQRVKYGAKLFKQGALVGGVIQHPAGMSDDAYRRLQESFEEQYAGVDNAGKTVLLEEGATFNATGMKAIDAQFLESMKYNWSQVCGIYRVPPHMTGNLERATFSNIEHQDIGFVKYTMLPWFTRWEERITLELLGNDRRFFAEFLATALLRGDSTSRANFYRTAIMAGWMTRNEARMAENMEPGPKELDEFIQPLNVQPVGSPPLDPPRREETTDAAAA